jgi:ElaB/YqjD/DUF883 family membrane-anchored ribosome-binding protein
MVERRTSAMKGRMSSIKDRVMGTAGDVAGSARSSTSMVGEKLEEAPEAARRTIEGNPLAVGLIAAGFGMVIASLLPETEAERRIGEKIQPEVQQLAAQAAEMVQDTKESLKPEVEQAKQELKGSVSEATESVKETVKDTAS